MPAFIQSLEVGTIDLIRFKEYLDLMDFNDTDIKRILEGLKDAKLKSSFILTTKDKCPFRMADSLTGESSSYCLKGDCPYGLDEENKCSIFILHTSLCNEKKGFKKIDDDEGRAYIG